MDETQALLTAILGSLKELGAKVDGLETRMSGLETRMSGLEQNVSDFRTEVNQRLDRIETEMSFQRAKLMDQEKEIWILKHKLA